VLVAAGWLARRSSRQLMGMAGLGLLIVVFWMTPRWVVLARELFFSVEPATQLQAHGISHALYIGLGVVENRFGIKWRDGSASEAVKAVAPNVAYLSPEYFRIVRRLYLAKVREDPGEVLRIYKVKAGMLLTMPIFRLWPSNIWVSDIWVSTLWEHVGVPVLLWQTLAAAIALLAGAGICRLWILHLQFERGLFIGIIAVSFVALFVVQGVLAHPRQEYPPPIGLFVLLLAGVELELLCRAVWSLLTRLIPSVRQA
jgi:hypothetical protein